MKHLFSILIILLVSLLAQSQNYFPKGAIWHYHLPSFSSASFSFTTIESKGDSIFNGDTLTFLEGFIGCADGIDELVKQVGQKIYRLNKCDSTFSLLYDFGANVGDTIVVEIGYCYMTPKDSMIYIIDSIKPKIINANLLSQFFISYLTSPSYLIGDSLLEGIGGAKSLYPVVGFCDPTGGPLRCYEDSVIGYYNTGFFSCDTVFVGIDELFLDKNTTIYPNPTANKVFVKTDKPFNYIELFNLNGQKLLTTKEVEINLDKLSKGVYFIKIHFEEEVIYRKIIKE